MANPGLLAGERKPVPLYNTIRDMGVKRIAELDGLRAFAVAAVVIFHMLAFAGSLPRGSDWVYRIAGGLGASGVNIFFVISGYIITTLLLGEKAVTGTVSLTGFYTRRFFRIIPAFAVYLIALVILRAFGTVFISSANLLWSALFLGNTALFDGKAWLVSHTWSLSVEEQFYLLFPPLLCYVLHFRLRAATVSLVAFYGLSLCSVKLAKELSIHYGAFWMHLIALFPFRCIIVGVLIGLHGVGTLQFLRGKAMIPVVLAAAILMPGLWDMPIWAQVVVAALAPLAYGLFVMWFVQNPSLCGLLRRREVQWVGRCSYSIYLWQQLFTGDAKFYHGWTLPQSPWSVAAIFFCGGLSYYSVERPCIHLGKWLLNRFSTRFQVRSKVLLTPLPVCVMKERV